MTKTEQAISILNKEVESIVGLSLNDLPDTSLLGEFIDTLEEMIENKEDPLDIKEAAKEFAQEFLEEEGLEEE